MYRSSDGQIITMTAVESNPMRPWCLLQVTCTAKTCPGKWMSFNAIFPQVGSLIAGMLLQSLNSRRLMLPSTT
jgi:hypothetical protein